MGLFNELSCEAGSFSHCHLNPHRCFSSEVLRLYFPALEPWVARSVSLPSCSSWFMCTQMWDFLVYQLLPCCESSPSWLQISTPPTGLDECFFFNFLVIRLPNSQFSGSSVCFLLLSWLISFWLWKEAKRIYPHLTLGQKSESILKKWGSS